jgi:hypothetical protein
MFCPSCGKIATDRWASETLSGLLDVAYHHLVLSIPWELRPLILMNRKEALHLVCKAAIKQVSAFGAT